MAEHFRHAVRTARVERRELALRYFAHTPEHLTGGCLIEPDGWIDTAHGFESANHALRVEFTGQHRLIPGCRHERHRREVVELMRGGALDRLDQRELIEHVGLHDGDTV